MPSDIQHGGRATETVFLTVCKCVCVCVLAKYGRGVDDDGLMGNTEVGGRNMYAHAATV